MLATQVMSRNVATCRPNDTLDAAACRMWQRDIGCLPVVDDSNRVTGILTDRDICMAAYTQGRRLADMLVSSAMARTVFCGTIVDRVEDIEAVMRAYKVGRVPILDEQKHVVGVVSFKDLVREAAEQRTRRNPDLSAAEIVTTLASIGEPRHTEALLLAAE